MGPFYAPGEELFVQHLHLSGFGGLAEKSDISRLQLQVQRLTGVLHGLHPAEAGEKAQVGILGQSPCLHQIGVGAVILDRKSVV